MNRRLEDIGRMSVMIEDALDHELFSIIPGRPKDFLEYFNRLPEKQRDEFIYQLPFYIRDIEEKLCELSVIAHGDYEE